MKGALIVCHQSVDLLGVLISVAGRTPQIEAASYDGSVQLTDASGRKLTAFADPVPSDEWRPERHAVAERLRLAEPESLISFEAECRWEDLFCYLIREASEIACLVVVDGNNDVYLAPELKPESIQL